MYKVDNMEIMEFVKVPMPARKSQMPKGGTYEFCPKCGSRDIVKAGVAPQTNHDLQGYLCRTCKRYSSQRIATRPPKTFSLIPHPPHEKNFSWSAYNESQINEKLMFLDILWELCSNIPDVSNTRGRPSMSIREMTFCIVCKVYEGLSSRRVSSDLELAFRRGYISRVPHFTTLLKYYNQPCFVAILYDLIKLSSLPLREFESTFAIDATGLSPAMYSRWVDERINKKIKNWVKVHAICGVKTNIITSIEVSDGSRNDCPFFPKLVLETSKNFRVKEILADKAYLSRKNLSLSASIGAIPYIPFKSNSTPSRGGSSAWSKMYHYFQYNKEDFLSRYHLRNNVESLFSSMKRKFSPKLMFKNELSQTNEALSKALCHNICVLIGESHQMGFSVDDKLKKLNIKSDKLQF